MVHYNNRPVNWSVPPYVEQGNKQDWEIYTKLWYQVSFYKGESTANKDDLKPEVVEC